MIAVRLILTLFGIYISAYVLYQALLFVVGRFTKEAPALPPRRHRRFLVLVPAHNEELLVPRLLRSLTGQDYPADRYRIGVIADNCSDRTAEMSRALGADVYERTDATRRGKGYAINWVLTQVDLDQFDAVVMLDADSVVNDEFLTHMNLQMERGDEVVQSSNGVANPGQSWFTRLMEISETIANEITNPARSRLGLSCCLLGNGMCFDVAVLKKYGWHAFSVGEDWEYYARLVKGGIYIGYSRSARQYHQESATLKDASSQRLRWTSGRLQVLKQYGPALLVNSLRRRSFKYLDACLQLVFPNVSLAINVTGVALVFSLIDAATGGGLRLPVWFAVLALIQFFFFVIGVFYTEEKLANARALFLAPAFLVWKLGIDLLSLTGVGAKQWKPTARRLS